MALNQVGLISSEINIYTKRRMITYPEVKGHCSSMLCQCRYHQWSPPWLHAPISSECLDKAAHTIISGPLHNKVTRIRSKSEQWGADKIYWPPAVFIHEHFIVRRKAKLTETTVCCEYQCTKWCGEGWQTDSKTIQWIANNARHWEHFSPDTCPHCVHVVRDARNCRNKLS